MDVIAHRGYSGAYPENTMLAFKEAVRCGADGIELDIHLSKDGEMMIIHDEALVRTTGRSGSVYEYTRSELERIDASKTIEGAPFSPIPSLEEYLDYIKDTPLYTNIELKTAPVYYPEIEKKAIALVRRYSLEDRIIFSSFNWLSVYIAKTLAPEIRSGLLYEGPAVKNLSAAMKQAGIECYHPHVGFITKEETEAFHRDGRMINTWTANSDADIAKCIECNIDGIITNYPEKARKALTV